MKSETSGFKIDLSVVNCYAFKSAVSPPSDNGLYEDKYFQFKVQINYICYLPLTWRINITTLKLAVSCGLERSCLSLVKNELFTIGYLAISYQLQMSFSWFLMVTKKLFLISYKSHSSWDYYNIVILVPDSSNSYLLREVQTVDMFCWRFGHRL